ncbi:unnamed protein product [Caenorhabditis auriculariae]|uniref:Carboxylesterase type B domain-containing protein n=1 Tax=Caenorhabditis auriculariae TaxID=2777116 RepID=A0A8S1H0G4_9PELO|nr:unnamed protein product [Caenorhabditis auriculariae]
MKWWSVILALTTSQVPAGGQLLEKSKAVWVEQGLVRGKIYNMDGKHIQIFRGIPYAEPPIGDLRFKKPVKKGRWHHELSAVEYGPPCMQFMDFHRNDKFAKSNMKKETEDCLYLNVFSPYDNDDESKVFPILVWIHGGSFLAGSADTGIDMEVVARNIVQKGVAFVSINYRLGPLGFINYNEGDKLEGNFGVWDMVMALQWIQSNIKQFNGDPTRVTVMGESAGGAAASLLALSPRTQGLVHQAIVMSGSSMAGWAIHRHSTPSWSVDNLSAYLRCEKWINAEDAKEVIGEKAAESIRERLCKDQSGRISCLTADLNQQQKMDCLRKDLNFSSPIFRKVLSIELGVSKMVVDGDLVPSSGIDLVLTNARIPIMTGVARKEWAHKKALFYNMHRKGNLTRVEAEEAVYRIIDGSFHEGSSEKLSESTLMLIANATFVRYLEHPSKSYSTVRVVSDLQKVESDIEFVAPCQKEVSAYAEKSVPVYLYSFDYVPENPIYEEESKQYELFGEKPIISNKPFTGSIMHLFFSKGYSSNFEIKPFSKKDEMMAQVLTTMLTNFVKNGNPSTQRLVWPAYTQNDTAHVSINLPSSVVTGDLHWPDTQFWNTEAELISKYIAKDVENAIDPDADLTNEERVQLSAYRRSWYALWVLVIIISILLWSAVAYFAFRKSKNPRSKPYDNILLSN